jgi:hypothetical protein
LFNNCRDYVASNWGISVNAELRRMWKEGVMVYFKVLSQHLPSETEEIHKKSVRTANLQAYNCTPDL